MAHHKIKARDILADIRSRVSDEELMDKFQISKQGLHNAFEQLLRAGLITKEELRNRSGSTAPSTEHEITRAMPRHYLVVRVEILEKDNPANKGIIKDINEIGVGIVGMRASLGEVVHLAIPPSDFTLEEEISFDAQCRWTKLSDSGAYVSGHQIVAIDDENLQLLRRLIHDLSLDITQ